MFIDKWKRSALAVLTSLGPLTGCGLLPEGWSEGWDTAGFFAGADERPAMVMGTDPSAPMPVRRASIADHPAPATLPPFSGLVPPDASRPAGACARPESRQI